MFYSVFVVQEKLRGGLGKGHAAIDVYSLCIIFFRFTTKAGEWLCGGFSIYFSMNKSL